jgi:urea transport system substrate-binding protein
VGLKQHRIFSLAARGRNHPGEISTLSFSIGENELRNLDICGDYAAWIYFQKHRAPREPGFLDAFCSRHGPQRVTSDPMEAAYVGVNLRARAVAEVGSPEPAEVRAALRYHSFSAPEGLVHLDPDNLIPGRRYASQGA